MEEVTAFFSHPANSRAIDMVTVTAKGEPTLHSGLGTILRHIKTQTGKPLAVLTNGTTLMRSPVRQALMAADVVIPSLDSAREASFRKIDRPAPGLDLNEIIAGLITFSHEYRGRIWLEILLSRGINDSDEDLTALQSVLTRMRLDRVQLNTVLRPPAEPYAQPLATAQLAAIAQRFSLQTGVPVDFPGDSPVSEGQGHRQASPGNVAVQEEEKEILRMIARRPCTAAEIDRSFDLGGSDRVRQLLERLVKTGIVQKIEYADQVYFQCAAAEQASP